MPRPSANFRGVTLIELMITLIVLSLLATLALPSYRSHVLRSHRAIARAALVDLAAKMEVEVMATGAYPENFDFHLAGRNAAMTGLRRYAIDANAAVQAASDERSLYEISLETSDPAGSTRAFRLLATAVNDQTGDRACPTLSIDSTGRRLPIAGIGAGAGAGSDCWTR